MFLSEYATLSYRHEPSYFAREEFIRPKLANASSSFKLARVDHDRQVVNIAPFKQMWLIPIAAAARHDLWAGRNEKKIVQ